jgi:hypothetical protein
MDLLATLRRSGGIDALARQIGRPPPPVAAGAEALLPALLGALRAYAQGMGGSETGVRAMLAMMDGLGDGNLAAEVMGPGPLASESGDRVLLKVFGSRDAAQRLAADVAALGGHDPAMLQRILPVLAMLVCGYLSARVGADVSERGGTEWLHDLLLLDDPDAPRSSFGTRG